MRILACVRFMALSLFAVLAWQPLMAAVPDEVGIYERRIEALQAQSGGADKARQAGRKAAFFCVNCHGESGVSALPKVPNLAGQNAAYLMVQIQKFADGRRKDDFMSGLIRALKEEERLSMAIYFAAQPVPAGSVGDARGVQRGRQHYARACVGCHGANARGGRNVARLAGQQQTYLVESLARYRNRTGERTDPVMSSIAARLTDEQIADLAGYLTSLP